MLSLLLILMFFVFALSAQQNHFIYLQTENKQPFYIKLDKKILSSSVSGYLIIPKLQDGDYILTIGFPKNEWAEQNVTCNVNKKDVGYLLKNFEDKGWGLFNLQTMEVVMSGVKAIEIKDIAQENKQDDFTNTLSKIVKDPSIGKKEEAKPAIKEMEKTIVTDSQKENLPAVDATVIKTDSKVVEKAATKEKITSAADIEEKVPVLSQIKKMFSITTAEGTDLVYIDMVNGKEDTIRLFIPAEKNNIIGRPEKIITQPVEEAVQTDQQKKEALPKAEIKANQPKFINIELPNPNAKVDTATLLKPVTATENKVVPELQSTTNVTAKPVLVNSDCKNLAVEEDFLKLRKKMAAENNDDDMVDVAKKVFKYKCFTTEQIKNLCVLFLKDEGKYKFFDAAYPFVSDSYNFNELEAQLSDSYFTNRFKAMIKH